MSLAQGARPNANGNLFEIRTVQSAAFRTLIEALKEILTEANLEFDSTGIKVIDVDETHTVLTYLRLNADRFEYFYCPVKYVLGINMIYLFKLIKTLSNNDSLTLFLPANILRFHLHLLFICRLLIFRRFVVILMLLQRNWRLQVQILILFLDAWGILWMERQ